MCTPRSAARRIAPPTTSAVSGFRSKSYCARSSVRFAAVEEHADCGGDVERALAAVGQSADGDARLHRSARRRQDRRHVQLLSRGTARCIAARARRGASRRRSRRPRAARRRGARLPRHEGLGRPAHLGAPAHGHRAGRGDRHDRARGARRARAGRATSCSGTSCRRIPATIAPTAVRPAPRSRPACRSCASSRAAAASSPVGRIAHEALRRRPTSGTRRTAERPPSDGVSSPPDVTSKACYHRPTAGRSGPPFSR